MPTLASARAAEATALGLLLAQVDQIVGYVIAGAAVPNEELRLLVKRRDEHLLAFDALTEAFAVERAANASRANHRIDLALRKGRGELEEMEP